MSAPSAAAARHRAPQPVSPPQNSRESSGEADRRVDRLRVLHVIPAVAQRYGGPSEAVARIGAALAAADVDVAIVSTDADGPATLPVPLDAWTDHRGIPTRFFPRQWSESVKYSRPLAAWLRGHAGDYDLLHIHAVFSHSSVAAASAARQAGVPYLVRPLGSLADWALSQKRLLKRCLWRFGVGRMLHSAAAIHCTSPREKQDVDRLLRRDAGVVIPLGVDVPPDADLAEPDTANPYILALGRLHPAKGLDLLIPAFRDLARDPRFATRRLVLAGDGDPAYVRHLQTLAADAPVTFRGWVSGPDKADLLRRASLLAMPSRQENFGMSAFEALAHSVPVLLSDRIDWAETIHAAGAGWTTPLDPARLRESLSAALSDPAGRRERGRLGRALVRDDYSWSAVAARLTDTYSRLLPSAPPAARSASAT